MKKSFYIFFLIMAFIIFGSTLFLFFYFNEMKESIHKTIFNRMLNEIESIAINYKNKLIKVLPKDEDWYEYLKKHPKLQKHLQYDLSLFSTHNIEYIYLLGLKNNRFIFLADGSKKDKAEFGEVFEPLNKQEFEILRPHYFFHKRIKSLYLTYIYPIIENNKLKGMIVIDVPYKFLNFIKSLLEKLSRHIYVIMFFSVIFFFLLILFSIFDYRREIEKEKLLHKLKKMNEELEEKVKSKVEELRKKDIIILHQSKLASLGEMLNMIAHQWRQPLNSLSTAAITIELKEEMGKLKHEECKEFSKFVQNQTQKMSEIIEDFMNFSKPDRKSEVFTIKEIIDEVLKIVEVQLKNHNINVILNIDDKIKVKSFKKELSHVLLNLIANARDALEESKKENKFIKIYSQEDQDYVFIIVEDNAGGIPPEIQDRIFEPYFTTKAPNKGTGIGLYMSKKIIEEKLNGKLEFQNTKDGVKFIIKLKKEK